MFLLKKNLLNNLKTYLYWSFKGPYKPEKFWSRWGNTFIQEQSQKAIYPQHKWILKKLIEKRPKTLLEVGCGFGRNIKYIANNFPYPLKIVGVDFSESMLENARNYIGTTKLKKVSIKLMKANVLKLPFANSSFDIVLCHGVLMHIKPEAISQAVSEILRVTQKKIILVEENDVDFSLSNEYFVKINYYTFVYPYQALFLVKGGKILEYHRKKKLDWFLIEKSF